MADASRPPTYPDYLTPMQRRTFLTYVGAFATSCATHTRIVPVAGPQRGIAFDAYRAPPIDADFRAIKTLGATHVALFPFGFMNVHTEPTVSRFRGRRLDLAIADEGLIIMGTMARKAGLRVVLIPTLADFTDGHWRGEVRMNSDASWDEWFVSYRDFILHYASLAEQMRAAGMSVGTELRETVHRESQWREVIGQVRERFHGWLSYAANWDDYDAVPWWDAVDLIGVQAYFELGDPGPGDRERRSKNLIEAWRPIKQKLAALSETTDRRIVFTEIGYKSHSGTTEEPWKWELDGEADAELQAAAYDAAFRTFWSEPWFAGFYWWKWRALSAKDKDSARDFTPQGKPAEQIIRRYYSG